MFSTGKQAYVKNQECLTTSKHHIAQCYHKPQLHRKVFCCMNVVLLYTMDLTLNLFYVDNLILV